MKKIRLTLFTLLIIFSADLMAADQVVINNNDSGAGSLRQAIVDVGNGENITFNLSSGNETITISSVLSDALSADYEINTKGFTIDGDNTSGSGTDITIQVTTPGTSTYRIFAFDLRNGFNVTIQNMTLKGGDVSASSLGSANDDGGVIWYLDDGDGSLTLDNITMRDGKANKGGGIYSSYGDLSISSSTITTNTTETSGHGGGIYSNYGTLSITSTNVTSNTANGHGGGIYTNYLTSASVITQTVIAGNEATSLDGGGLHNNSSSPVLTNCVISGNFAGRYGGAIANWTSSEAAFLNCTITGNYGTHTSYGAIINGTSDPTFKNTIIWNNSAGGTTDSERASIGNSGGYPNISYCLIANWNPSGTGNIDDSNSDTDPNFVTDLTPSTTPSTSGDFHLTSSTPAGILNGATLTGAPSTDIEGNSNLDFIRKS